VKSQGLDGLLAKITKPRLKNAVLRHGTVFIAGPHSLMEGDKQATDCMEGEPNRPWSTDKQELEIKRSGRQR
jgi:hypothetical protein